MLALAASVPTHPATGAGEVRAASGDQSETESRTEDRPESHFYGYLLDACEKLFEGEFDQTTFEENMRFLFGTKVRRLSDSVYSLCFPASPSILVYFEIRWYLASDTTWKLPRLSTDIPIYCCWARHLPAYHRSIVFAHAILDFWFDSSVKSSL